MKSPWITKITGDTIIPIGEEVNYKVLEYKETEGVNLEAVHWTAFVKENGVWRELRGPKKPLQPTATFTFINEKLIGKQILIEAYGSRPERKSPPGIIATVQQGAPKIVSIDFTDSNGVPIKRAKYGQTVGIKMRTTGMVGRNLGISLWKGDAPNIGHSEMKDNEIWSTTVTVTKPSGVAETEVVLSPAIAKIADKGFFDVERDDEFHVYVESENIPEPVNSKGLLKAKGFGSNPPIESGRSVQTVDVSENITSVYFAKEEFEDIGEEVASEQGAEYSFKNAKEYKESNSHRYTKQGDAEYIYDKIKNELDSKNEFTTIEEIKSKIPDSIDAGTTLKFKTFKKQPTFKKIDSAPLGENLFLVATTVGLEGKEVSLTIKEKEGLIKGSKDAILPSLEVADSESEEGAEKTTFRAPVKNNIAKVPIKLRPKSEDELTQWQDKIKKENKRVLIPILFIMRVEQLLLKKIKTNLLKLY